MTFTVLPRIVAVQLRASRLPTSVTVGAGIVISAPPVDVAWTGVIVIGAITGDVVSLTVIVNVASADLPALSIAVHVTSVEVGPGATNGAMPPGATGSQLTATLVSMLSVAAGRSSRPFHTSAAGWSVADISVPFVNSRSSVKLVNRARAVPGLPR